MAMQVTFTQLLMAELFIHKMRYFSLIDGRLSLTLGGDKANESVVLKYQLLNPSHHFKEIVDVARCVILAGGTMSPVCLSH